MQKSEAHTDSPPPYQPADGENNASSSTGAPHDLPPPTNYLVIKREHNAIRETYAIDAGLSRPIPEAASEQSIWATIFKGKDAARPVKNLLVASTHGSVDVNVWLVGEFYRDRPAAGTSMGGGTSGEQLQGRRAELDISSVHGSVTAKLVSRLLHLFKVLLKLYPTEYRYNTSLFTSRLFPTCLCHSGNSA